MPIDPVLESLVRQRAANQCEYCHFPEEFAEVPFQIEHILSRQHGGKTTATNLALACAFCNHTKDQTFRESIQQQVGLLSCSIQESNAGIVIFNGAGAILVGKTSVGRSTIHTLAINRQNAVVLRRFMIQEGTFPL